MLHYPGHLKYNTSGKPSQSEDVPALVYGCMDFAKNWDKHALCEMGAAYRKERSTLACDILECCLENGLNFFDHADIYGCGKSEEIFAQAMRDLQVPREQYILQSKCGIILPEQPQQTAYYDFTASYIVAQAESSLRRLQTDYLDILLLHRPDALVDPAEVAGAFAKLQRQGKVLAFGVSNHSAAQIALLQAQMPFPLAYNQMQISLLHHELLSSGLEYNTANPVKPYFDIVDYCRLHNIRLQAWSPVARGKIFSSSANRLQRELAQLARAKNCSPGALAIAWLLHHPAGIQPVMGTTKVERLKDYCNACAVRLSKREWYQLLVAAREKNLP
ncbi:MAG: aldo/keto reductase [Spirochaetota bacterium]